MNQSKNILLFLFILFSIDLCSQINYGNGFPATDALNRKLITSADSSKKEKYVGLFYWTWHNHFAHANPYNIAEILKEHPEAINDYNSPFWPKDASYYFWGEPLFGYYKDNDKWVLRKHAEMLADAGVDVIFFDCTNGSYTWKESYMALCKEFDKARKDGVRAPQIAFMLTFHASDGSYKALREIYTDLYKPELYKDLWFMWKGKPMIMAYPDNFTDIEGDAKASALNKEIREFFTFRPGQPVYNYGIDRPDNWGWSEIYPQNGFVVTDDGFEQVTVSVAQNWSKENGLSAMNSPNTFGRSYTDKNGQSTAPDAVNYGLNFQEQWERALEMNPEFIFITGWNEWNVGQLREWMGQKNAFPDQFSQEKSRDIEPMKGGHGDNYYYQMVHNIRRFKGAPENPKATQKSIKIDGDFSDWENTTQYNAYKGNTEHRNEKAWGKQHYTNTTGRNDISGVKVAHDKKNIYFYVETSKNLSPATDPYWMELFIDIDRNRETGWEGYDFVINRTSPKGNKAIVERNVSNGWKWEKAGEVNYKAFGNKMEIAVPRKLLKANNEIDIEFKWADNAKEEGDIMNFYLNGDVAPLGRFNYSYTLKP